MDTERIEAFAVWLQAQPMVTAEACAAHEAHPLTDEGQPMPLDDVRTLLLEAGYVALTPLAMGTLLLDLADVQYMPAALTMLDVHGHRVARPATQPATMDLLRNYVEVHGSPSPPNAPGMWLWLSHGQRDGNVRFRPCGYNPRNPGSLCFLWPDRSRPDWQPVDEVRQREDGGYDGFQSRGGHGTWICAPLPADAFAWLLQVDDEGVQNA